MLQRTILALALALTAAAFAPDRAAAGPIDPERYSSAPTGWGWYFTASASTIDQVVEDSDGRVIDVEVVGTSPLRFAVSMVSNSGTFARTGDWTYGHTVASLLDLLEGRRLLDLEAYTVNGVKRYAAVWVANGGSSFKSYKWWVNATPSFIADKIDAFGGRIVDIDKVSPGRYNVVLLKNTGPDAKGWGFFYALTPEEISTQLTDLNARLVDIEPEGDGRYTVVLVEGGPDYWWWHPELTADGVTELQAQTGMRIYDIERYSTPAGTRYAVLLINTVGALTTKLRQIMWPAAKTAAFGFYLKKVDGPVITALQHEKVFEPASMIKVLHHLTALRAVKNGTATLTEDIDWYRRPDIRSTPVDESAMGGICAYEDDGTPITTLEETDDLSVVLSGMMKQSDNRMTDAVFDRFGRTAINNTAAWVGMTDTVLNHRIGCTPNAPGDVDKSNELTLADDGRLFEKVARAANPILGTGTLRDTFYSLMGNGLSRFNSVVAEEADDLEKPASVVSAFKANMRGAYKPGGYLNGVEGFCNQLGCTKLLSRSTGGGWIALPFKTGRGGAIVRKGYVYGNFVDGIFDCGGLHTEANPLCAPLFEAMEAARDENFKEMLRPQIRAALKTW